MFYYPLIGSHKRILQLSKAMVGNVAIETRSAGIQKYNTDKIVINKKIIHNYSYGIMSSVAPDTPLAYLTKSMSQFSRKRKIRCNNDKKM